MIKSAIFSFGILLQCCVLNAQETLYDHIKLGRFQVGYMNTLLFDTNYQYEAYDYAGVKPQFVQIWYPLDKKLTEPKYLTFNDFFDWDAKSSLSIVHEQLKKHYKEAVVRDCIEENLVTGKANYFGTFTYPDILDLIGNIETKSILQKNLIRSKYPIIIYHHGSQGYSFENYAMAEYFASRGFVFISANFHLPYENIQFGLKPFAKLIKGEDEQSLKSIFKFAQSLSDSASIYFVGHSWGAQMGLRTFDQDSTINGLISLETTIEFKTDFQKIKEMWPEVFQKVITENSKYPFPILFCAATGQEKSFDFFKNVNSKKITFAPTKKEFEHNAYTSTFYLRYLLNSIVPQADKEILIDRLQLFVKHLELINEFIERANTKEDKQWIEIKYVK